MVDTVQSKLWQAIVAATANLGPDATALRIPLWVEFRQRPRSFKKRIGAIVGICRQFLAIGRRVKVHFPNGGVLVCFPHHTLSNVNNMLPVATEAFRRGLVGAILTFGNFSEKLADFAEAVPIITEQQLVRQLSIPERLRNLARMARVYKQVVAALSQHLPGLRLARRRARLLQMVGASVIYGSIFKRFFATWAPDCIVSTSDFWPFEHQLCCQAKLRQVPSLVIQHGTIDYIWWPFVADLCCLWGDAHVDQLRSLGAPPHRLTVVGMPATDKFFRRSRTAPGRQLSDRVRPVCLILSMTNGSSAEPEVFRSYRQFTIEAINLIPFVTWKVKLHPVETDSFYRELGDSLYGRLTFHPSSVSLEEAVNDADVVTTIYSTAGLETMVMDRPLIVAPATARVQELAWWPMAGGGRYAASAQEFEEQLNKLISDQNYRRRQLEEQRGFLTRSFANQGHAAEHMVDLLGAYSRQRSTSRTLSPCTGENTGDPTVPVLE
jgi:hypothetical protein